MLIRVRSFSTKVRVMVRVMMGGCLWRVVIGCCRMVVDVMGMLGMVEKGVVLCPNHGQVQIQTLENLGHLQQAVTHFSPKLRRWQVECVSCDKGVGDGRRRVLSWCPRLEMRRRLGQLKMRMSAMARKEAWSWKRRRRQRSMVRRHISTR